MIKKRLILTLFAVTVTACGESAREDGFIKDLQVLFQHAIDRTLAVFSSEPPAPEDAAPQAEKPPVQNAGKPSPMPSQLAQMMASMQSAPQVYDQKSEKEELEQYRLDYTRAADVEDKAEALIVLVQADEKNAVALLQDAYSSPEPVLRKEAVLQMHDFNDKKQVVDMLLKALDDPDTDVVMEAVEGLSGLTDKRVIAGLKKVAKSHPDELVREVAQDYADQAEGEGE